MKVLIIGLGSIAKKHIKALKEIDVRVTVYALRSSKKSGTYEDVINVYSIQDIESLNIDFCIISSPTALHHQHINQLTSFTFPLFIEKPLSHTLKISELEQCLDSKKTYVACNLRFLDALEYVKQEILPTNTEKIQEVEAYCGSYLPEWRQGVDYKKNYSAIPELGGGVHLDLIHEVDYIYWLFGKPIHQVKTLKSQSALNIESIDYASYQFSYEGFETHVTLNYYRPLPKRTLEIVFETYIIKVDLLTNTVYKNDKEIYKSNQLPIETYRKQLEYFINTTPTFNTFKEALVVLNMCLNEE